MGGHIVKITLEDTHPPVWRRVVLPEHISFWCLHQIIQKVFGWEEEHPHEFSFPQQQLRIGDSSQDSWGDVLEEGETDVDDFLMSYNWIRYTYDFGDDWRHKIVYEKEEPEYGVRYAAVRKFKGDNYMEDSGGIWGAEDDERYPFSLEAVNKALEAMKLPVAEYSSRTKETVEALDDMEEVERLIQSMLKGFAKGRKRAQSVSKDIVGKKLERWEKFYEKWEEQPKEQPAPLEEAYEQMVLPGIELPRESQERGSNRYSFEKRASSLTEEELLGQLNQKQAEDYCKYLRISAGNLDKRQQTAAIAACLREHPEYLLYVLCKEDLEYLREILVLLDGPIPAPPFLLTVHRLVSLGLMDVAVEKKGKNQRAVFCLAADAASLVGMLTAPLCKKTYRMLKDADHRISCYILAYGVIDMDTLYERYTKDFKKRVGKEDFLRIVYWHGNFVNLIRTVYRPDGTSYAASRQLDVETIMEKRLKYSEHSDYYPFPVSGLKEMREHGYGAVYPFWAELAEFFCHVLEMEEEEALWLLDECYLFVMNGCTAAEILERIETWYKPETLAERIYLWNTMMMLCLHTGLPMLKGYSRVKYGKKNHQNPYRLDLVEEEWTDEEVKEDTSLFYMPCKVQQEVKEILDIADVSLRIKEMEGLKRKLGVENGELLYILATCYIEAEKFTKAEACARALRRIWPQDLSVQMLDQSLTVQSRKNKHCRRKST